MNQPLKPDFLHGRLGGVPSWCQLKYECLGDYCILCGMIGHKRFACRAPPNPRLAEGYKTSLIASSFSSYRVLAALPCEEDDTMAAGILRLSPIPVQVLASDSTQSQVTCYKAKPNSHYSHASLTTVEASHVTPAPHSAQESHPHQLLGSYDCQPSTSASFVKKKCPLILPSPHPFY